MNLQMVRRRAARQMATGAGIVMLVALTSPVRTQQTPPPVSRPAQTNFDEVEIRVLPVQRNVYMLLGAGGNTTVQVGSDGVLVVDTQFAPLAPKILAAIRK